MRRSGRSAILLLFLTVAACADVVTIPLTYVFSGTGVTQLTATFTSTTPGTVDLTMSAVGLDPTVYVTDWAFNFNPSFDSLLGSLTFTWVSGPAVSTTKGQPDISASPDSYSADGDGSYDIHFSFPTSRASLFSGGQTSIYRIQGSGLTASYFDYLSTAPPGKPNDYKGPFYSAAHLQGGGAGNGAGAWIGAVPEPTSYPVYSAVMAVLCVAIWQRIRSKPR